MCNRLVGARSAADWLVADWVWSQCVCISEKEREIVKAPILLPCLVSSFLHTCHVGSTRNVSHSFMSFLVFFLVFCRSALRPQTAGAANFQSCWRWISAIIQGSRFQTEHNHNPPRFPSVKRERVKQGRVFPVDPTHPEPFRSTSVRWACACTVYFMHHFWSFSVN